ncbi:hypothetical protein ACI65C_010461 [Semiaphis heraclei]
MADGADRSPPHTLGLDTMRMYNRVVQHCGGREYNSMVDQWEARVPVSAATLEIRPHEVPTTERTADYSGYQNLR